MTIPDYTDSEEEIRKAAFACLKRIELKKKVRLVGVRASNLIALWACGINRPAY
ncbi:MAG: hypothetical protein KJ649_13710 [Proteobacteria bacterium]|nr:hypothetical protein [Pseudomonadota bacterium]MBU1964643.1 hypothetical protein [Pseudomonadota bacterium]